MSGEIYVKFYKRAVEAGLLQTLEPELFVTLTVLATFMDKEGRCFPSQTRLAELLGVNRKTVNVRMKKLCEIEWQREPLLQVVGKKGYGNNVYQISRKSGFCIF